MYIVKCVSNSIVVMIITIENNNTWNSNTQHLFSSYTSHTKNRWTLDSDLVIIPYKVIICLATTLYDTITGTVSANYSCVSISDNDNDNNTCNSNSQHSSLIHQYIIMCISIDVILLVWLLSVLSAHIYSLTGHCSCCSL